MVTMFSTGITIQVEPKDVGWYKRAGYVVVDEPKPVEPMAPAQEPELIKVDAPADDQLKSKGKRSK